MPASEIIHQLVERFEEQKDAYRSGQYKETQLRREFLDPFFEALGWDVQNRQGYAEAYKEVIHEDSIKVGVGTKAPDYAFRIGRERKFFVEAKAPAANIKEDISPAYQLRRYAWSARLPLSILTDFEEFAVYDCRGRPDLHDKASTGRVQYLRYPEYLAHWDELAAVFSKDAVLKGSFDKYAESTRGKRGTAEVDDAFLEEISGWRDSLAHNIALRNEQLSQRALNYAVQMTIDRVIFLRICEDRGVEPYGQLQALLNGGGTYERLIEVFRKADARYNSGLFHFHPEKGRPADYDSLSLTLQVDDKTLKDLLRRLYYPDSPYEFSMISADILGQVYEQFLGKVIRLTAGHHAVVEDKPEVKKAGGVYYTPTYIVDYIVRQTVGAALEGKTPKGASAIKIVDPACGSGSFLLGAYQCLLDWHRDRYAEDDPHKWAKGRDPALYLGPGGEWRLTSAEKKRILLNNIYGVDIDPQAVEVTKLSLLLKVLEGESAESLGKQLSLFQERALPDLGQNIQCGNSLIGPDYYAGTQMGMFDEEERYRVNPFDWGAAFPQVFGPNPPSPPFPFREGGSAGVLPAPGIGQAGFDVVIGNPPYGAWLQTDQEAYLNQGYQTFGSTKDVYTCFIEKGIEILKDNGDLSFIIPSAWLGGPQYSNLRLKLVDYEVKFLVLLPFDIFENAYIDTLIMGISNQKPQVDHIVKTYIFPKREKLIKIILEENDYQRVTQEYWKSQINNKFILDPHTINLLEHIRSCCSRTLTDIAIMKRGVLFDKSILSKTRISDQYYPYFEGDVYRYLINIYSNQWVEFSDKMKERPKEFFWFEGERILLRRLVNRRQRLMASITNDTFITNKNIYSIKSRSIDSRVLLGMLNSRLLSYLYIKQVTQAVKDDFPQVTIKDILSLPLPDEDRLEESKISLMSLVEVMLSLNKLLAAAPTPDERARLQRQIEAADKQIDALVYALYGLTEEEIKIVENRE